MRLIDIQCLKPRLLSNVLTSRQSGSQGFMGKSRMSLLVFSCGVGFLLWSKLEWVTYSVFTRQTNLDCALFVIILPLEVCYCLQWHACLNWLFHSRLDLCHQNTRDWCHRRKAINIKCSLSSEDFFSHLYSINKEQMSMFISSTARLCHILLKWRKSSEDYSTQHFFIHSFQINSPDTSWNCWKDK